MTARDILNRWIQTVNAGHVDEVVSLYADGASLLPTFSARTIRTQADRTRYFESLGARPNLSVSLHEPTFHEEKLTDTLSAVSGIYAFRFEMDKQLLTFEARFTFVIDTAQAAPILHHHSSQIPRALG